MRVSPILIAGLFTTPALSQTLNKWRNRVFPICCYNDDPLFDGDPSTSTPIDNARNGNEIGLLLNSRETFLGFYIKSSSRWIAEAEVTIYDPWYNSPVVGKGFDDQQNPGWMVIPFYYPDGEPGATASSFTIIFTGIERGNWTGWGDTWVNEIWPIYPGDEIAFPAGYTPPAWTPIKTIAPVPQAPGLSLDRWPVDPTYLTGASNAVAIHDRNVDTTATQPFPAPEPLKIAFFSPVTLKGFYVLSNLVDYHVVSTNAYTREEQELCRVTNVSGNFTLCPFIGDHGGEFFYSNDFSIVADGVRNNASVVEINEVWPIFAGDETVDPRVVDVYASS